MLADALYFIILLDFHGSISWHYNYINIKQLCSGQQRQFVVKYSIFGHEVYLVLPITKAILPITICLLPITYLPISSSYYHQRNLSLHKRFSPRHSAILWTKKYALLKSLCQKKISNLQVLKKISKTVGLLRKIQYIFPRTSLITIYKLFDRPHLDYGDIIYDQTFNESFHQRIESIQYNAITGAIRGTSSESFIKS